MNTTHTLIGSYNRVLFLSLSYSLASSLVQPNEAEIVNHKTVKDNSVILNLN